MYSIAEGLGVEYFSNYTKVFALGSALDTLDKQRRKKNAFRLERFNLVPFHGYLTFIGLSVLHTVIVILGST